MRRLTSRIYETGHIERRLTSGDSIPKLDGGLLNFAQPLHPLHVQAHGRYFLSELRPNGF